MTLPKARNSCDFFRTSIEFAGNSAGTICALWWRMPGWTCVEEVIAYQLAVKLRDRILALIDAGTIPFNYHLRDQIADAARSAPANISEGFDRYKHGQFGYHTGVAKASLAELKTHLQEVRNRGFLDQDTYIDLLKLLTETKRTTSGLLKHLKRTEAPEPWSNRTSTSTKH